MTDRELMQQALDALEFEKRPWSQPERNAAIEALRARLAQPEPEPVAWWCPTCNRECNPIEVTYEEHHGECGTFIGNTNPPQREWQGLTDEEIEEFGEYAELALDYIRLAEAKLREKNETTY